jgi:hypothetical protein
MAAGSGGLRKRFEDDFVTEALELADGAAAGVLDVALGDDFGALLA